MRRLFLWYVVCIGWFSMFMNSIIVEATSLDSFEATITIPDSQTNKELMYYDLLLEPKKSEKLSLEVKNTSEQELSLALAFHRAVNNTTGAIIYSDSDQGKSNTAKFDIEKLVQISDEQVTLKPNEAKTIQLQVTMPNEEFAGVLAGGLHIQQIGTDEFEGNVQNLFAREIALLLRNNMDTVVPAFKIDSAAALQENGRNAVTLVIENTEPTYVRNVEVSYEILQEKTSIIQDQKTMNFAPNTQMHYFIPLNGEAFEPGTYTVQTTIETDDGKIWEGSPTFTIEADKAKEYNRTDVTIEKIPMPWLTIGIAVAVGLLFIFVVWLIIKNKKLQKELKINKK